MTAANLITVLPADFSHCSIIKLPQAHSTMAIAAS